VLHSVENDQQCRDGDLVLIDVGASYANYSADLTRTYPVNGRFSQRQRSVYDAVLRVLRSSISRAVVGTSLRDWKRAAQIQMAQELVGLGLLWRAVALAIALQQLVEQSPLPLLLMRTVIQTATAAPRLHPFILDLLSRLVLKQVWKTNPKLWEGVLRCAKQLVPRSFAVYMQLPVQQLREALAQSPDLAQPLRAYANTPAVRPSVPGATLAALAEVVEAAA
jgi:hypothetical protein